MGEKEPRRIPHDVNEKPEEENVPIGSDDHSDPDDREFAAPFDQDPIPPDNHKLTEEHLKKLEDLRRDILDQEKE